MIVSHTDVVGNTAVSAVAAEIRILPIKWYCHIERLNDGGKATISYYLNEGYKTEPQWEKLYFSFSKDEINESVCGVVENAFAYVNLEKAVVTVRDAIRRGINNALIRKFKEAPDKNKYQEALNLFLSEDVRKALRRFIIYHAFLDDGHRFRSAEARISAITS